MSKEILIVDDEDRIRRLLKLYLERESLTFMRLVTAKKPMPWTTIMHAYFLDLMLPEMDGIEVASNYGSIKIHLSLCLLLKAKKLTELKDSNQVLMIILLNHSLT